MTSAYHNIHKEIPTPADFLKLFSKTDLSKTSAVGKMRTVLSEDYIVPVQCNPISLLQQFFTHRLDINLLLTIIFKGGLIHEFCNETKYFINPLNLR